MSTYSAQNISKAFSGVTVLSDVDFAIRTGEIHALVGENGSGKSTLIKLLGGVHQATAGHVEVDGRPLQPHSPSTAAANGLAIVHQDYNVFADLDVAMNLNVGRRLPGTAGLLDRREIYRSAEQALDRLDLAIDPRTLMRDVGLAERKLIEIGRALLADASFLILDEPTALLDLSDSARVLAIMRQLRSEGVGLAFVSHRLDEVLAVADHISVLRDGALVASRDRAGADSKTLVDYIVGPKATTSRPQVAAATRGPEALSICDARVFEGGPSFSLTVHQGEILGLTGLIGSGPLELARMLAGHRPFFGELRVSGAPTRITSPTDAIRAGIGYIPEDRSTLGLVMGMSVAFNLNMASLDVVAPRGILRHGRMRTRAATLVDSLRIRIPSLDAPVQSLSGGNQQKVQLGKWLASNRTILIIEAPTHGVDVGAKAEIEMLMRDYVAEGGAVIVASTDVPEVLAMCDRVAVFNRGGIVALRDAMPNEHSEILLSGAHSEQVTQIERLLEK